MKADIKNSTVAILISSYDGAEDLWSPLHQTYFKYWKDCPYKVYLGTNHKSPILEKFNALKVGDETSWSDNMLKCLSKINEKYILLTYDDLFLFEKINTVKVSKFIDLAIDNSWAYLRLHPSPLPDEDISTDVGKIALKRQYRASTVWALFNKEVLIDLLDKQESAWEFERNGSIRSDKYKQFYCSKVSVIPYINGVVKGKWVPQALNYLISDGIQININKRSCMTWLESLVEKYKRYRLKLYFLFIPTSFRQKLSNIKNKL